MLLSFTESHGPPALTDPIPQLVQHSKSYGATALIDPKPGLTATQIQLMPAKPKGSLQFDYIQRLLNIGFGMGNKCFITTNRKHSLVCVHQ